MWKMLTSAPGERRIELLEHEAGEEHRDDFSFHRWARQALGPAGLLLAWTPLLRSAVRRKAAARLEEYEAAQ